MNTNNTNNEGPVKPDVKKNDVMAEIVAMRKWQAEKALEVEAFVEVAELLKREFDVAYDWHEVLEIRLKSGAWVQVSLRDIEDPTPKAEGK